MIKSGIDVNLIPAVDVRNIASTVLESVKRFYENPKNVALFEAWKKQQENITHKTRSEV